MLLYLLLYLFIGLSVAAAAHEEHFEGRVLFITRALLWPAYVIGRMVIILKR